VPYNEPIIKINKYYLIFIWFVFFSEIRISSKYYFYLFFLKTNYYLFFIYFAFSEPSFQDLGYQFDVF